MTTTTALLASATTGAPTPTSAAEAPSSTAAGELIPIDETALPELVPLDESELSELVPLEPAEAPQPTLSEQGLLSATITSTVPAGLSAYPAPTSELSATPIDLPVVTATQEPTLEPTLEPTPTWIRRYPPRP